MQNTDLDTSSQGSIKSAQGATGAAHKLAQSILKVVISSQSRTLNQADEEVQEISAYLCEINLIDTLSLKQQTLQKVLKLLVEL